MCAGALGSLFEGAAVSNEKARAIFYLPQALCLHHTVHANKHTHRRQGHANSRMMEATRNKHTCARIPTHLINDSGSGITTPASTLSCSPLPFFSPSLSLSLLPSLPPSLPPVMYYECCLITQPRILHTGWHIYLFVLYLFASLLYAKSFCDRLVYSLALPC